MECQRGAFCGASTSTQCLSRAGTRCLHFNHEMLRILKDARGFSTSLINGIRSAPCRTTSQRTCDSTRRRPPKQGRGAQIGGELGAAMAELEEMANMMMRSTTSVLYCTYDCRHAGPACYTLMLARVDVSRPSTTSRATTSRQLPPSWHPQHPHHGDEMYRGEGHAIRSNLGLGIWFLIRS